ERVEEWKSGRVEDGTRRSETSTPPLLHSSTQAAALPASPLRLVLATLGAHALLFGGAYYLAWLLMGHWSPRGFLWWITAYGRDGRWWSFNIPANLRLDVAALAQDFTANSDQALARLSQLGAGYGVACVLLAALAVLLAWRAAPSVGRQLLFC